MAAMSEETAAALLRKLEALEQRDAEEAATLSTLLATVQRLAAERVPHPHSQPHSQPQQEPHSQPQQEPQPTKRQATMDAAPPRSLMTPEQFVVVATTLAAEGGPQGRRGAWGKVASPDRSRTCDSKKPRSAIAVEHQKRCWRQSRQSTSSAASNSVGHVHCRCRFPPVWPH